MTSPEAVLDGLGWFPLVFRVPLIELMGAEPVDEGDPSAGLSFVVPPPTLNAGGALHGGVLSTLLDLAAYLSVIPTIGPGEQAVTHAISAFYLRGAEVGDTLVARGSLLRRTHRLAFADSQITRGSDVIATASVTKSIMRPRASS